MLRWPFETVAQPPDRRENLRPTGDKTLNLWHDIIDSLTDGIIVLSPAMEPQVADTCCGDDARGVPGQRRNGGRFGAPE